MGSNEMAEQETAPDNDYLTSQPTGELRWVRTGQRVQVDGPLVVYTDHGTGTGYRVRLQQRWRVSRWQGDRCVERRDEWRDVPMVVE